MGVRGFVRDIASLYLSYKVLLGAMTGSLQIDTSLVLAALVLLFFTLWFLLEKVGILEKKT